MGTAIIFQYHAIMLKLPNLCSVYIAEIVKIVYDQEVKVKLIHRAVILNDSLSTLRSVENISTPIEIDIKTQNHPYNLKKSVIQ